MRDGDPAVAVARPVHVDVDVLPVRRHGELRLVRPGDRHRDGRRPRRAVIARPRVDDPRRVALQPDGVNRSRAVHLDDRVVLAVRDVRAPAEEPVGSPRPAAVGGDPQDDARQLASVAPAGRRVSGRERVHVRRVGVRRDRRLPIVVRRAPDVLGGPAGVGHRSDRAVETDEPAGPGRIERHGSRLRDVRRLACLALGGVLRFLRGVLVSPGLLGGRRTLRRRAVARHGTEMGDDGGRGADHHERADEHRHQPPHEDEDACAVPQASRKRLLRPPDSWGYRGDIASDIVRSEDDRDGRREPAAEGHQEPSAGRAGRGPAVDHRTGVRGAGHVAGDPRRRRVRRVTRLHGVAAAWTP